MSGQPRLPGALRWAGQVLSWMVMLAVGAALVTALFVPRLAGATPYVVETGSMRPTLPPGTLVVVKPVDPADITAGDVITYQIESGSPTVVTHRVIEQGIDMTGEPRWRTQGDANNAADRKWVLPVQLQGRKWYAVPYLGYATSFVSGEQRGLIVPLFAIALLGYAVLMFVRSSRAKRRSTPYEFEVVS